MENGYRDMEISMAITVEVTAAVSVDRIIEVSTAISTGSHRNHQTSRYKWAWRWSCS